MADSFEETIRNAEQEFDQIAEGNLASQYDDVEECTEDGCNRTIHVRTHDRRDSVTTERHPEAPETEVVCARHDVIASE